VAWSQDGFWRCSSGCYWLFLFYRKGVIQEPMLWSLYLTYTLIALGYLLIAIGIFDEATACPITLGRLLTMIISPSSHTLGICRHSSGRIDKNH
jgi:hypothetical protein